MAGESAEQLIINRLAQAPSFHPSGAKLFVPDWTLDPGDVVTVQSDGENYDVPIYSLDLTWNGACRADIQSTGNQQREPLSALRRKEYQAGRRGYGQFKEIDDEFKEFETWQEQTDETIGTYAAQFVDILGDGTNEGRLTLAETAIEQTASDATITAQAAGILLDEDGHPILDARGKYQYDPNAADTTLIAQINTNATEILAKVSQSDLTTTLSSYLQINAFSTELASTLDNGDTTLAAKIITAVNKNTNTSSVVISADQINLDGVVSAVFLDSRMANIDKLFTTEGMALEITAGTANIGTLNLIGDETSNTVSLKAIRVNGTAPSNIGFLGIGSDAYLDILTTGITNASVANNVLTLTKSDGGTVTFSKATSVSGEWGSNQQGQPTGVFTVTATQTNRNTTTGLDEPTTVGTVLTSITQAGHWGNTSNQEDPNTYYQSTNATINTSQQMHSVKTAEINASSRYIAGQNSVVSTFTKAQSLPPGITPTDFNAGELWRYHVTKDGADVADAYYRVLSGGGNRTVESLYPDTITLSEEETELSEHVLDAYYTSGTDTTPLTVKVDASAVFSAGVTQGMGGTAIDVVKDAWVTSTANMNLLCKFRPSAGDGNEQSVLIKQSPIRNQSSSTGTVNLTDYDENIGSVTLNMSRSGDQVILRHLKNPTVTPSTIIAGTPIAVIDVPSSGPTIVSDVDKIVQIGNIEYSSDYKTATIAVQAQDSSSRELLTDDITTSVESAWEAGRTVGIREGSGLQIEDDHYELITNNNTTVNIFPTRPNNVMSSASIRVEVPVNEGIQGATLLASTDSDTAWSGWQLNDYTTLSKKYGFIRITGKDGSTYSYGIDANGVFDAGVSAGVGVEIEDTKAYPSTITSSGDYEITPSSGKYAMKKATFSVSVPNIYGTYNAGQLPAGSGTITPPSGYYAMRAVTYSVASAAHSLDVYQNASVKTSAGLGVRSAGSVSYSDLSAGKYIRFGIECGDNVQSLFYVKIT